MGVKSYVIGIAGGSGSGKSTLAENLKKALEGLDVAVISTDSFFKPKLPVMVSPVSGKEYEDWNSPESLDYPAMLQAVRLELDAGHEVLVIEGLSVLYFTDLRALLDLKVFVDLDSDERMYRRIKRNLAWVGDMDEIATYFLEAAKHMESRNFLPTKVYADIIVNGNRLDGTALAMIASWAEGRVRGNRT